MGLVDYASSSDEEPSRNNNSSPARKKRKTSTNAIPSLPPLPASFHDLYASTVRTTTNDDPSLHQGRKRLIPHVAGNWPSHIYVEWHPTTAQHALLTSFLAELRSEMNGLGRDQDELINPTSLLTSDLGTPLPLHISLSRPIVLRTEEKDSFLEDVTKSLLGHHSQSNNHNNDDYAYCAGRLSPFQVCAHNLSWHRSPESDRSFLVLRVRSTTITTTSSSSPNENGKRCGRATATNPELATLLRRFNNIVARYGQPQLYSLAAADANKPVASQNNAPTYSTDNGNKVLPVDDAGRAAKDLDETAFHVSIAWSFSKPTPEIQARTAAVLLGKEEFRRGILGDGDEKGGIQIPVDSVKVKIGNVVTSLALASGDGGDGSGSGSGPAGRRLAASRHCTGGGLFGI